MGAAGKRGINLAAQQRHTNLPRRCRYVEGWRRHSAFWKTDRSAVLAKLRARRPSHAAFEQRLAQCQRCGTGIGWVGCCKSSWCLRNEAGG